MLLSPHEIRDLMVDRKIKVVAESAGVSYATLRMITTGEAMNATADTLQKLTDYFEAKNGSTKKGN